MYNHVKQDLKLQKQHFLIVAWLVARISEGLAIQIPTRSNVSIGVPSL